MVRRKVLKNFQESLRKQRIIPICGVESLTKLSDLISSLYDQGIKVYEITLRSPDSLQAITETKKNYPDSLVIAGTILSNDQADKAILAGADILISPGTTPELLAHCQKQSYPFIPGVTTPSDIITARLAGYSLFKLYPAKLLGGPDFLRAMYGPFPDVEFMATGGVTEESSHLFLELPNVLCVGISRR
jgi:2-dehydro-3-deoxyphosphogluconate aldolase/(4S)-4-hydroxy-2-oxoglutarate aldolase